MQGDNLHSILSTPGTKYPSTPSSRQPASHTRTSQFLDSEEKPVQNSLPSVGSKIWESEFNSQAYGLSKNLLLGSQVTELMRGKMRIWLMEESSRLKLSRRLCCLAGSLIDLFFAQGGHVEVQHFHSMGVACLLLANKLTDNVVIPVDHGVFPANELNQWEQRVCMRLKYLLNPPTYVDLMDGLLVLWNRFAKNHDLWTYQLDGNGQNPQNDCFGAASFYEYLDFLFLILRSYAFSRGSLELAVLKMVLERDSKRMRPSTMSIEDEVLISFWISHEQKSLRKESFLKIFEEFEMYHQRQNPLLGRIEADKRFQASIWLKQVVSQDLELSSEAEKNAWRQSTCEGWLQFFKKRFSRPRSRSFRKSSNDTTV